ncbi:hypothetical protein JW992_10440 [candidate division KSB1 bacterium]|nr:hypothetical protein [candidate division KSB1 bacterium]
MLFRMGLLFFLVGVHLSLAQDSSSLSTIAKVYADSSSAPATVKNLRLNYKFAGYGIYVPGDYPVVSEFRLENGEIISFTKIAQARLRGERTRWKRYIDPKERGQYAEIDSEGYYQWSDIEVAVHLRDWEGNEIRSRLLRPENSDVFFIGQTQRGDFSLQIDQENNKTVLIEFEALFIMQCEKDASHLFPNSNWKFCPLCGGQLNRIERPRRP